MTALWNKAAILGGRTGLLGRALTAAVEASGRTALPLSREDFDPLDEGALAAFLDREEPDVLLNAVAYTQVDKAEDEPEAAHLLNAELPARLGRLCRPRGLALVHFSTDFVFDGRKDAPYLPDDAPNPLSVYGATKLAGEQALLETGLKDLLIIRTAWLFGPGKKNFVKTILALAGARPSLNVVHDQTGSPTYTPDLARHTLDLRDCGAQGVFHLANAGRATWCELASEAVAAANLPCAIRPIPTSGYPTRAVRPPYSVLDLGAFTRATGLTPRSWVQAVRDYVFRDLPRETEQG